MSDVATALRIANEAHAGQTDKGGQPYVLHPIRMALRLETDDQKIVALLHDVVEDCPSWTFERIAAAGFAPHIIEALRSVTKDPNANLRDENQYMEFIRRAGDNPIGRAVKREDLIDNMDERRIPNPTDRDRERLAKYRRALFVLASHIPRHAAANDT